MHYVILFKLHESVTNFDDYTQCTFPVVHGKRGEWRTYHWGMSCPQDIMYAWKFNLELYSIRH